MPLSLKKEIAISENNLELQRDRLCDNFRQNLNDTNFEGCFNNEDVDQACSMWTCTFLSVAKSCIHTK